MLYVENCTSPIYDIHNYTVISIHGHAPEILAVRRLSIHLSLLLTTHFVASQKLFYLPSECLSFLED